MNIFGSAMVYAGLVVALAGFASCFRQRTDEAHVAPGNQSAAGGARKTRAAARDSDTVYLSLRELRKFGSIAARPLGSSFKTARWNEVLDGLLIFREEQAPEFPGR